MLVKVWNDNVHPFEQEFKGEKIKIAARGFVEMDYEDAVQFRGCYYPPRFDGARNQTPESYKMIRVDSPAKQTEQTWQICAACGDRFANQAELDQHVDKNHLHELEDQKLAEKRRTTKKET